MLSGSGKTKTSKANDCYCCKIPAFYTTEVFDDKRQVYRTVCYPCARQIEQMKQMKQA